MNLECILGELWTASFPFAAFARRLHANLVPHVCGLGMSHPRAGSSVQLPDVMPRPAVTLKLLQSLMYPTQIALSLRPSRIQ